MNELKSKLLGTWYLKSFEFTVNGKTESHNDAKGVSLFTHDDHFSVCLNQAENPKYPYSENLIKKYYSSGKFSIRDGSYFEENIVHAFESRIGEKREVQVSFKGKDLIKEMNFHDGSKLMMTWTKETVS
ncbi:MAG: hypothetical protein ACN6I6_01870 [bacterium]